MWHQMLLHLSPVKYFLLLAVSHLRSSSQCAHTRPGPFLFNSYTVQYYELQSQRVNHAISQPHCWTPRTGRCTTPNRRSRQAVEKNISNRNLSRTNSYTHMLSFPYPANFTVASLHPACNNIYSPLASYTSLMDSNSQYSKLTMLQQQDSSKSHHSTPNHDQLIKILFRATLHKSLFIPRTKSKTQEIKIHDKSLFAPKPKKVQYNPL